jgi:hypothetical protein
MISEILFRVVPSIILSPNAERPAMQPVAPRPPRPPVPFCPPVHCKTRPNRGATCRHRTGSLPTSLLLVRRLSLLEGRASALSAMEIAARIWLHPRVCEGIAIEGTEDRLWVGGGARASRGGRRHGAALTQHRVCATALVVRSHSVIHVLLSQQALLSDDRHGVTVPGSRLRRNGWQAGA